MIPITYYLTRRMVSRGTNRYVGQLVGLVGDREVFTGPIVSIAGRTVTTRSGSVYTLVGRPRWPEMYPRGTEDAPLDGGDPEYPFYLDGSKRKTWPPGAKVASVEAPDAR